jgi:metal-responsive CopG/Arc/MetJ family transcriptional regulator
MPEDARVRKKLPKGKGLKTRKEMAVRASISFPFDLYETLEEIAKQKKVSLAWVIRDAAEIYVKSESKQQIEDASL